MNSFFFLIYAGLTVFYITQVMIYSDAPQPFESTRRKVINKSIVDGDVNMVQMYTHPVGLFDRVRRLFGLYAVSGFEWTVRQERLSLWVCPKCLGFWVSLMFCICASWFYTDITMFAWVLPLSGFNLLLVYITDRCSD